MTDNLSHLPVTPLAHVPRHVLGDAIVTHHFGFELHQKRCKACGCYRLTVICDDGRVQRGWNSADGRSVQASPLCSSTGGQA